jgi:hypothetical protein
MKPFISQVVAILTVIVVFLAIPVAVQAESHAGLEVAVAAICQKVVDREPVDAGISFPSSVGRLNCFTKISGAQTPTQIRHVWYFGANERARVSLAVKSANWRTYSSKSIQPHEIGSWRVDVLDSEGTVLKELQFEITP